MSEEIFIGPLELWLLRYADRGDPVGLFTTLEKAKDYAEKIEAENEGETLVWDEYDAGYDQPGKKNWTDEHTYFWIQPYSVDPEPTEWEGDDE